MGMQEEVDACLFYNLRIQFVNFITSVNNCYSTQNIHVSLKPSVISCLYCKPKPKGPFHEYYTYHLHIILSY